MMGFMTAYKRLDNLCKDMNGAGISGYIEDMESMKVEIFSALEWKDDYDKLKHYRYIRNRIAHDNDADEDTLCTPEDAEWLEQFYQQILHQTDPLALCYKKSISHDLTANTDAVHESPEIRSTLKATPKGGAHGWLIAALVILIVFVIALIIYLFF